jgi:hypothetical protein
MVALLALAVACGGSAERHPVGASPATPEQAALALFALAQPKGLSAAEWALVLAAGPELLDRSAIAAGLRALASASRPRVIAVVTLSVAARTAVDLEADLLGGGTLRCSAQAVAIPDGTWRIAWFETPTGSWPARRAGSGDGLTSSAPPR